MILLEKQQFHLLDDEVEVDEICIKLYMTQQIELSKLLLKMK
jgi:hypothetical protein